MSEKTVDEKVQELRKKLLANKIEKVILKNTLKKEQKISEYKNIKNKNRKRNKLQKTSL